MAKGAYIGVDGLARPCWSGGELTSFGTVTISVGSTDSCAATIGNKSLFRYKEDTVYYDENLTEHSLSLEVESNSKCTAVGGYFFLGGGTVADAYAYDTDFTAHVIDDFAVARYEMAVTSAGKYAMFSCGRKPARSEWSDTMDVYDSDTLTHTYFSMTSKARSELAATSVGEYAMFGGGRTYNASDVSTSYTTVDVYDKDTLALVSGVEGLSTSVFRLAATTLGKCALFGGGSNAKSNSAIGTSTVNCYNKDTLTKTLLDDLFVGCENVSATTVEDFALFAGGAERQTGSLVKTVTAYRADTLTRITAPDLSVGKQKAPATTLKNYALFGAAGTSTDQKKMDVYAVL